MYSSTTWVTHYVVREVLEDAQPPPVVHPAFLVLLPQIDEIGIGNAGVAEVSMDEWEQSLRCTVGRHVRVACAPCVPSVEGLVATKQGGLEQAPCQASGTGERGLNQAP